MRAARGGRGWAGWRIRAVLAVLAAGAMLAGAGCHGGDPSPTASPPSRTAGAPNSRPLSIPPRSGLPWRSGVYVTGSSPQRAAAFAAWRGRPLDVVLDWPARATWDDIIDPEWLYTTWAGTPYTKVFGVPPFPEQVPGVGLAACAAGHYDERWRQFGEHIRARGLDATTVIRLGWEFNGDWYAWSARDPAQFAGCWRHIVDSAESRAPALRWEWTVNRGENAGLADPRRAWPGDGYVDVVGVDSYDGWPAATGEAGWREQLDGRYGLRFWADFAAAHGKPFSVPEWGVYPGTAWRGHNGGDNAFYVRKMAEFFRANSYRLGYEAYFNEPAPYYAGALHDPALNPRAAASYLRAYHPGNP